jgi:NAD(P)-dependent dehydrogenase (short-subunit alcohol dehydrogenase family)
MKVLITGASRGIGLFLSQKFAKEGHQVMATFNKTEPTDMDGITWLKMDIANHAEVAEWVSNSVSADDEIVLINCAGSNYNAVAHKADINKWKKLIDINLIGTFSAINAVLPLMREKNWGRIINFSSIVAQKGIAGTSAYAASKAAMWGMSRAIAAENAKKGITINNLNLGYFDIGMITDVPEEILAGIVKTIPAQTLGNPENIYNAVQFLINSEYITGASLDINGGLF